MKILKHDDVDTYKLAFDCAMEIFKLTKRFPKEEMYSLTDQIRRSSRSVCVNLSETWRKRRYKAAFINKLSDSEAEAAETQTWVRFAYECSYIDKQTLDSIETRYNYIIGKLVKMISNPEPWLLLVRK